MTNDDAAPATKKDFHVLQQSIQFLTDMMTKAFEAIHDVEGRATREFVSVREEIRASEERINDQLQLAVEILKSEALGAHGDKIAVHDDVLDRHDKRITRVEKKIGLAV